MLRVPSFKRVVISIVFTWSMPLALGLSALGLVACGSDDDDKKEPAAPACQESCVTQAVNGVAELDFSSASAGEKYVLMPYVLGDTATVNGANGEKFSFTVTTGTGAATGLMPLRRPAELAGTGLSNTQLDHLQRSLYNRFDPKLGVTQVPGFWATARKVDQELARRQAKHTYRGFANSSAAGSFAVEKSFQDAAQRYRVKPAAAARTMRSAAVAMTTIATDCPAAGDSITVPEDANAANPTDATIPTGGVVSGSDYCIVYLNDPVTGGSKTEIEASVKEIMRRYKEVLYKDDFAALASFTFKPHFVIVDVDDEDTWPSAIKSISGSFMANMSDDAGVPLIYMPADFAVLDAYADDPDSYDAAKGKKQWHGTLAHEANHAIMYYYHLKSGEPATFRENAAVDEGLAHYMEDLFGYGDENFADFAKGYLDVWTSINAFLHETEDGALIRGGAQAFWYYLISQKGGVTFTDGAFSGGDGVTFIAQAVKERAASTRGPANLAAKFGDAWSEVVGNFFGALALYGTTAVAAGETKFIAQTPEEVTDLNGNTGKTYGMKYNNFGGLPASPTWDTSVEATTTVEDLEYYSTQPLLYTVTDPAQKLIFTASGTIANTAVSVVRIE